MRFPYSLYTYLDENAYMITKCKIISLKKQTRIIFLNFSLPGYVRNIDLDWTRVDTSQTISLTFHIEDLNALSFIFLSINYSIKKNSF